MGPKQVTPKGMVNTECAISKVHERKPAQLNEVDKGQKSRLIRQSGSRLENHTASSGIHWRYQHEDR